MEQVDKRLNEMSLGGLITFCISCFFLGCAKQEQWYARLNSFFHETLLRQ